MDIGKGEVAVATADDQITLIVPSDDDAEMTELQIALVGCGVRLQRDPEFIREMAAWFMNRAK